jgi:predicted DNA-binding transcriptional regulator YafY
MNRSERFYKIDQILHERRVVSTEVFLQEMDISRATLKRDMEYLRDRFHAPIVWDREAGGYRFASVNATGPAYALPGVWFSAHELYALLAAHKLLSELEPGILLAHLAPLQAWLTASLEASGHSATEITQRVRLLSMGKRAVEPRFFADITTALLQRQRLEVTAWSRGRDEINTRTLSPQRLIHYRDNWYLDAWCHQRQALRNFALDAITRLEPLNEPAREVSAAQLSTTFGPGYGIFSGGTVRWARLRFSTERARWVAQEQWHPEQSGKFESDGSCLLRLPYTDHRELIMDILKHGTHCEVLGPPSLRRVVWDEVKKMLGKYF